MSASARIPVEVWSPLPPQESGIADYVQEQLESLDQLLDLTLVVENPADIDPEVCRRFRVVSQDQADTGKLRLYHVGNSPLHGSIYREAVRTPGVVVLHEWNLHELLLGFAVTTNDFEEYKSTMRREHGERGTVAGQTIASALGGRHWSSVFPLNAEILGASLAVVCLSASTAKQVEKRTPGLRLLHLDHHAKLISHTEDRAAARARLGLSPSARIVLAPGLGTASKSLGLAHRAVELVRARLAGIQLVTVGGRGTRGAESSQNPGPEAPLHLGRVDLKTLGDALLAADVVLALRFPSRGETSGVLMRALAAGRAAVISSGSTADEDLPDGVVARVNPGPSEQEELAAILTFLLKDEGARRRLERLALTTAAARDSEVLSGRLAEFLAEIERERPTLSAELAARQTEAAGLLPSFRNEIEAAGASLGLARLPPAVYERLAGLL